MSIQYLPPCSMLSKTVKIYFACCVCVINVIRFVESSRGCRGGGERERMREREDSTGENFIESSSTICDISRILLDSSNQREWDEWSSRTHGKFGRETLCRRALGRKT